MALDTRHPFRAFCYRDGVNFSKTTSRSRTAVIARRSIVGVEWSQRGVAALARASRPNLNRRVPSPRTSGTG